MDVIDTWEFWEDFSLSEWNQEVNLDLFMDLFTSHLNKSMGYQLLVGKPKGFERLEQDFEMERILNVYSIT
jgi:hypothetical protein